MSDKPKFEVIDRRKMKAQEEQTSPTTTEAKETPSQPEEKSAGPQLVVNESGQGSATKLEAEAAGQELERELEGELPPAPTAEESSQQKAAYEASSQRLEDVIRAQNPAMDKQPPVGFEHKRVRGRGWTSWGRAQRSTCSGCWLRRRRET
jgi:hypothetical protein